MSKIIPTKYQTYTAIIKYNKMLNQCKTQDELNKLAGYLKRIKVIALHYEMLDDLMEIYHATKKKIKEIGWTTWEL